MALPAVMISSGGLSSGDGSFSDDASPSVVSSPSVSSSSADVLDWTETDDGFVLAASRSVSPSAADASVVASSEDGSLYGREKLHRGQSSERVNYRISCVP